jgi:hypothetical protein
MRMAIALQLRAEGACTPLLVIGGRDVDAGNVCVPCMAGVRKVRSGKER